jgi:hypothetical protein
MVAFIPGASPPLVNIAIRFTLIFLTGCYLPTLFEHRFKGFEFLKLKRLWKLLSTYRRPSLTILLMISPFPPKTTFASSVLFACAANITDFKPEPQNLLIVNAPAEWKSPE